MTGEYSYIDTFCGLITVKYTATPDNYEEKREYEPDFIDCSGATTQAQSQPEGQRQRQRQQHQNQRQHQEIQTNI